MDCPIFAEAMRLSSLGLACHWLWPKTKIPVAKEFQKLPWLSPHVLRGMHRGKFNLGLHTGKVSGARFCVVAVDVDGPGAGEWVRKYLPRTPIVSVSANGEHWIYRYPEGVSHIGNRAKIRTKDGQKIDLDLRADGGNLAIPPSIHPSGVIYRALNPWTEESLCAMPVFDPEWIPSGPVASARPTVSHSTDDMRLKERARRLCLRWQTSERGSGHGTDTWKLAGYLMHTLGLSEVATYDAIATHYNPRCPTPYGERELLRKVNEAATKRRAAR